MLHTGYLTVDSCQFQEETGLFKCEARIPNAEVTTIYNTIISTWLSTHAIMTGAVLCLFNQDYEGLADNLQHMLRTKYHTPLFAKEENSVEEVYHSLLLSEFNQHFSKEYYDLLPEEITGQGVADILCVDHQQKIVIPIELKRVYAQNQLEKSAQNAVQQVIRKNYGQDPKYHSYQKAPAIGISFFGIQLAISVEGVETLFIRHNAT